MSHADAFLGGDHAKAKSHIRNLIHIAGADGNIDEAEMKLLIRIARKFELSREDVDEIMAKLDSVSFTPPANKEDRNLQLYNLGRMVMADGVKEESEMGKINRFAIGLGYKAEIVPALVDKVIEMIESGSASDDAIDMIQNFVNTH
ncbi:MAG: TerB family tellurite resistance protein [Salibacteraceae bacterium]